jgi:hypothetical protein
MGFVVDKVALGQVFSEYFGFPCQFSFHQSVHNHPHVSSGADTIGQKWPQYKGLTPTPLAIKKIGVSSPASHSGGSGSMSSDVGYVVDKKFWGRFSRSTHCFTFSNHPLMNAI